MVKVVFLSFNFKVLFLLKDSMQKFNNSSKFSSSTLTKALSLKTKISLNISNSFLLYIFLS